MNFYIKINKIAAFLHYLPIIPFADCPYAFNILYIKGSSLKRVGLKQIRYNSIIVQLTVIEDVDELKLYEQILSLSPPWTVVSVILDDTATSVNVYIEYAPDALIHCPHCHQPCPRYDSRTRKWRHLDTCQYQTYVHASIPRVECDQHGISQVAVPWAEQNTRFTALIEAKVIDWLHESSINAVARRFGLSWNAIDGIMQRAVKRGLKRQKREK